MRTGADPIPPTTWQRALGRLAGRASPSRVDRPFQVVSETPTAVSTGGGGPELAVLQYDLVVPYLSIGRRARTGAARLFVPQAASGPMPLIVAMHYELGLEGAAEYLEQGWAVLTPREGLNPLADAVNLNLALVQAGRQLPFADGQRIALVGGSAGGYVTLMVASEAFPLAAAAPLAPLVSLPYNIAYFACNLGAARCGAKSATGEDASAVPVFCSIAEAITGFAGFLGPLEENCQGWFANSPVGVLDLVTSPVLAAFSTADALVPIN